MLITQNEVEERVSILKRFKQLLTEQRDRFRSYLDVLDKQKDTISKGSVDDLAAHVELEEKIVADICSIQKSIEPIRALYEASWKEGTPEIPELVDALEGLREEAAQRMDENRVLLESRMIALRNELKILPNPFKRNRRSIYADTAQPTLLDIKG